MLLYLLALLLFKETYELILKGSNAWPPGCQLKFVNGCDFKLANQSLMSSMLIPVKELMPNEMIDISVSIESPKECGIYQCQLRLYTQNNQPFGQEIWFICTVEQNGILGITQQLNNVNMFDMQRSNLNNTNKKIVKLETNSNFINPFSS